MESSTTRRQTEKRKKKKENQAPQALETSSVFFRFREKNVGQSMVEVKVILSQNFLVFLFSLS